MSLLLKRALDSAAAWHKDQLRKYPGDAAIPYISHLAGVVAILSRHRFDEEVIVAGALHDVVEDCGVTIETLKREFGSHVADLVQACTEEDKSLQWEERKAAYLAHFAIKSWGAQAISLADKIDNFESIVVSAKHHGDPWPLFKRGRDAQIERFETMRVHAKALPHHPIVDEYEAALEQVLDV